MVCNVSVVCWPSVEVTMVLMNVVRRRLWCDNHSLLDRAWWKYKHKLAFIFVRSRCATLGKWLGVETLVSCGVLHEIYCVRGQKVDRLDRY